MILIIYLKNKIWEEMKQSKFIFPSHLSLIRLFVYVILFTYYIWAFYIFYALFTHFLSFKKQKINFRVFLQPVEWLFFFQ